MEITKYNLAAEIKWDTQKEKHAYLSSSKMFIAFLHTIHDEWHFLYSRSLAFITALYNSRSSSLPLSKIIITDVFFSYLVEFQDSATSSCVLLGSSLTLLGTLQKKEGNVTVNYGPGTMDIKFISVCYCMRTQNHIATRKNLLNTPQWKVDTMLISHITRLFLRKCFITHCTIFHIGTTKLLKFLNVSHLHVIKY